jgi:hypothetical protein
MSISDLTGPYGDDDRDEPFDGEDDAAPFDDEESPIDELPLAEEESRLPWLEGDEDEEDYAGYSSGQTVALVFAALLVLCLVVGGIWWLSRAEPDAELVADGSTIPSEGPYKERPDDPGGKVFAGTGDSSFKVSEGQTSSARLDQGDAGAAPGFQSLEKPGEDKPSGTSKPAAATSSSAGATDAASVGVQVGAFSSRAGAEAGWESLSQRHDALKGVRHRVVEGKADIGTVYRLQALAGNAEAAKALCGRLEASGLRCHVKP